MEKISKNGKEFYVNSFKGSFFEKLFRAIASFFGSFAIDSFWSYLKKGMWEKKTFFIFDNFLDDKHSYIDMGAWIGPTVLYGSQIASHCYAIEPDPIAFAKLKANIEINPILKNKITLYNGAIWKKTGSVNLSACLNLGDSGSSILKNNSSNIVNVQCMIFKEFISTFKVKNCNFIKIDIEGAEVEVLDSMKNYLKKNKPVIHLSLHPFLFNNLEEDSNKIIDILKIYKNIYTNDGKKMSLNQVLSNLLKKKKFDIVILDYDWNYRQFR